MLKFIDKYFWWSLLTIIVLIVTMSLFLGNYSDKNSLISKLKLKEYKRLVSIVNKGFLSSFIIVIFSFFTLLFRYDLNKKYNSFEEDIQKEILDDELRKKLKQFLDREL